MRGPEFVVEGEKDRCVEKEPGKEDVFKEQLCCQVTFFVGQAGCELIHGLIQLAELSNDWGWH